MEIIEKHKDFCKYQVLKKSDEVTVLKHGNNIYKIFTDISLVVYDFYGVGMEEKILESEKMEISNHVILPNAIIYENGEFRGYRMSKACGITYKELMVKYHKKSPFDLKKHSKYHFKIERAMIDNPKIIFTDIATTSNIFVDLGGEVKIIDYDSFQIGEFKATSVSTNLFNSNKEPFYNENSRIFNKLLDIQSSFVLYYQNVLGVNLNQIGSFSLETGKEITLDSVFDTIHMEDGELYDLTKKILNGEKDSVFLEGTVLKIAENYEIENPNFSNIERTYSKRFRKKHNGS